MLTAAGTAVGPATVTALRKTGIVLATAAGEAVAQSALTLPYEPAVGDVVLAVVAEDGAAYIIGVLSGRGRRSWSVAGDLDLRASGTVRIQGDQGICLTSPNVSVRADKVETLARTLFERTITCYRWVKDTLQTHAGRTRTVVEGNATLSAARIVETAEKEVKIDGSEVHLG